MVTVAALDFPTGKCIHVFNISMNSKMLLQVGSPDDTFVGRNLYLRNFILRFGDKRLSSGHKGITY